MKKLFLAILLVFPLCSCSKLLGINSNFDYEINKDFDKQIEIMNTSENVEELFQAYQKATLYLEEQYDKLNEFLKNSESNKMTMHNYNKISKSMNLDYWKNYEEYIVSLNEILQYFPHFNYFNQRIENALFYRNLDVNRIFTKQTYEMIDGESLSKNINSLINKIEENQISYTDFCNEFENIIILYSVLMGSYSLTSIYQDLYPNDKNYYQDYTLINNYYSICENEKNELFKAILASSFREKFIERYQLLQSEIDYFDNIPDYSEKVKELIEKEVKLETEFSNAYNQRLLKFDYQKNYLELVKVRRNIAEELNHSSYLDYVWSDFGRDYSIEDSRKITLEVLSNNQVTSLFRKFLSQAQKSVTRLSNYYVDEKDIFKALELTNEIHPSAKEAILELQTFGNYNFENRNDKYSGSYVSEYNISGTDYFILLGGINDATLIPTAIHEFGHYLGLTKNDKSLYNGLFSLDICEVHSQGLEYLMTNYFHELYSREITNGLIDYQIFNALWTIISNSIISEFEYYVYTTEDELTIDNFDKKFRTLLNSLGGTEFYYYEVPHIYLQSGYCISYVTSLIPSLDLWTMDLDKAKESYKTLIEYGESNGFINVLEKANINSPFNEGVIDNIVNKFSQI